MASKAIPASILVLRIVTLLALVASVVVLVRIILSTVFVDLLFVLATAAIGAAYTLIQLPFDIYYACTRKRLIRNGCMAEFDFYADKLVSLVLASGVGAGFCVGFEFKRVLNDLFLLLLALGEDPGKYCYRSFVGGSHLHGCDFRAFLHQSNFK
ncbi:CASP-like protein 4D1 [Prunus yedoensis var. nudiflora]|uniref:CASP-like protein 4D1 n=1 Tax=Prunus yedoensis var. nudiflora TaxID=2094558 RepID=A0A314UP68_PRUYE|nr:CASP-like protein 4D1 [Prunus yedoensis var. nudiflora]